jgi:putative ABC transport system permease protein
VTTGLTVFSIALSVLLLVSVDRVRQGAQEGLSCALGETDLVVGARGGALPLLLYSVFHLGAPSNEISYASYEHFRDYPAVQWTIPLSMGESHQGYCVIATDENFYEHYRFHHDHSLQFADGTFPQGIFDAVIGSEVAEHLGYHVGSKIVLRHGLAEASPLKHGDMPFTVVGILAHTATSLDRAIYITLYGQEAIHLDWPGGTPPGSGEEIPAPKIRKEDLHIRSVSLLQREINNYRDEPLTAIFPALTLQDLYRILGDADAALSLVGGAVLLVGLAALLIALYSTLDERRKEVAVLRAIGFHARQIFILFVFESALISAAGLSFGLVTSFGLLWLARAPIEAHFGMPLAMVGISSRVTLYACIVVLTGALVGCIPAIYAYRNSLLDGLNGH